MALLLRSEVLRVLLTLSSLLLRPDLSFGDTDSRSWQFRVVNNNDDMNDKKQESFLVLLLLYYTTYINILMGSWGEGGDWREFSPAVFFHKS